MGGARRVVKSAPKAAGNDDKKVQTAVKRLGVNIIPGIEHVRAPGVLNVQRLHTRPRQRWMWA